MSVEGKTKAGSYKDILIVPNSNNGIDATTRNITSGDGSPSALNLSDDQVAITPKDSDGTAILKVTDKISLRDAARFWIRTHVAKPTLYDPLTPATKTPFLGKLRLKTGVVVKESVKELNERIKRLYDLTDDVFDKR